MPVGNHLIKYMSGIIYQMRAWTLTIEFFIPLLRFAAAFRFKACQRQQFTTIDAGIFSPELFREFPDQRIMPLLGFIISRIIVPFYYTKLWRICKGRTKIS